MKEKIRFGILGFGIFGKKRLIPGFNLSIFGKIHAITKRSEEAAKAEANQFGIPKYYSYSNKARMLADPEIDAIYVAGPNHLHMVDTIDALNAGKHVLLEKPMAMNSEECKKILEAANKTQKKLMIAQCLRYNDTVNYFKNYRESGRLGELLYGTADYCFNGSRSPREWLNSKKSSGGGPSFDLGPHTVDTLRYITGLDIVDSSCWSFPKSRGEDEVEQTAIFMMNFDKGFTGRSIVSFITEYSTFLELVGTKGTIRATRWTLIDSDVTVYISENNETKEVVVHNGNQYSKQIDDFCKCIIEDTESPIPGSSGLINQQVIDKINDS